MKNKQKEQKTIKFLVLVSLLLITFLLLFDRDLDFSSELWGDFPLFRVYLKPVLMFSSDLAFFLFTSFWLVLFDLSSFLELSRFSGVLEVLNLTILLFSVFLCLTGVSKIFSFSILRLGSLGFFLIFLISSVILG